MGAWLADFCFDLRRGVKLLRKSPGFTAAAVLTLALGIGATSAIFSVLHSIVLRPLPFPDAEQLVSVEEVNQRDGRTLPAFEVPVHMSILGPGHGYGDDRYAGSQGQECGPLRSFLQPSDDRLSAFRGNRNQASL